MGGGSEKPKILAFQERSHSASQEPLKPVTPEIQTDLPAKVDFSLSRFSMALGRIPRVC